MKKLYNLSFSPYMPWLKNALGVFAFLFILLPNHAKATCQAGFTYTVSGDTVFFKNTSTNSTGNPTKYFWNFGDDLINYDGVNPTHKYYANGNYVVTLNSYDTIANCHSVITDTITINIIPGCNADFGVFIDAYKRSAYIYAKHSNNYQTYFCDFGDSTTNVNDTSKFHIYTNYGVYTVCFAVRDSTHSCYDTVCKQITISKPADLDSCKADFSYYDDNSGKVYFYPVASCGQWQPSGYFWNFGDGDTSYSQNVVHTYKTGGPYNVTLVIKGTGSAITDTVIKSVYLNNTCKANYKKIEFSNLERGIQIYLLPSTKFEVNFGDGTVIKNIIGNDSTVRHTYLASGNYTVCYKRYDTLFNCKDSVCYTEEIKAAKWCYSGFNVNNIQYSRGVKVMSDSSFDGLHNSFYEWDFGDGIKDTGLGKYEAYHTYAKDSTYTITLTVSNNANTCTSSSSKTVIILYQQKPIEITGKVLIDASNLADSAIVYLIQVDDSIANTLTLIDTAIVVNDNLNHSTFRFTNIVTGKYMIKAALAKNSQYYQIFFPTYYRTSLKWSNAQPIYIDSGYSHITYADVYLKIGTNPGGPGFIGGKISAGANKKEGDPLEDIQVMLFTADHIPVTYTYSDKNGNFKFENLAFGQYEVYTEVIGLKTNSALVTISAANPKIENIEVKVSSSGITTSIKQKLTEDLLAQPKLYPNPAQNNLYLETDMKKSQGAEIVIYNITGQQVYSENIDLKQGKQIHNIATDKLSAGLYMLQLKNASRTSELQYKFIKTSK